MNRRDFTKRFGLTALSFSVRPTVFTQRKAAPQISITMDDFTWNNPVKLTASERNEAILSTLKSHNLKAALFVQARNVDSEEGKQLLLRWDMARHLIGNHTYSHRNFGAPNVDVREYINDIGRAELILIGYSSFRKYFRFPMLKEGATAATRDAMREFLNKRGYKMGYVTIDNSDWLIDQRLTARLKENPSADVKPYRDYYLEHMWDRAQYYDSLSNQTLGRSVKHTILTHFNLLNGLFLEDLIQMFKSKGWVFIDAEEAFTDSAFSAKPKILPAGESIVWALAKEKGTIAKSLRYPAEDGQIETARMNKLGL
jgi:peptidoglycan/xylan/chitin deacetylase (PgdA/CDA1 family)